MSSTLLLAHSGHPGPETHGDMTHFLVGLAVATPAIFVLTVLKLNARKKAKVKVSKQD